MFLIFDTMNGLCNQMYDIIAAINFCQENQINFSFRHASFRYNNMTNWYKVDFNQLFNESIFEKKYKFYNKFNKLKIKDDELYILNINELNDKDILTELKNISKEYILINNFWKIYSIKNKIFNILSNIEPNDKIMNYVKNIYEEIKRNHINYNFIHYRYENDFLLHHNLKIIKLHDIINKIHFDNMWCAQLTPLELSAESTSKTTGFHLSRPVLSATHMSNTNYKIYIATTEIYNILSHDELQLYLYKDEKNMIDLNIEERAFIDFMIGKYADNVYGHSKSSFSMLLNELKMTQNYYDMI